MQWLKFAVSGSDVEFDRGYFSSAVTASLFSGSHAGNGSELTGVVSASYAVSASWAPGGSSVTASYALTASYINNANLYYVHTQSAADVLWVVNHNLGADYVNVTAWSGSDVVIPQRISVVNSNTLHVTFPVSESGYVVTSRGTFTQTSILSASYALSASWAPGGASNSLGVGFTNGGGSGYIPHNTLIKASSSFTITYSDDFSAIGLTNDGITMFARTAPDTYIQLYDNNIQFNELNTGLLNIGTFDGTSSISITDYRVTPLGLDYRGNYGATIKSNDRSIPDVGTIRTHLTASYATSASYYQESKTFGLTIDGGGSAITTGVKGDITIPFNCTIDSWYITADQVGSIVIDVWKDVFANFPPTVADSISGTEKPTLSSAASNSDTNLTTWTTKQVSSGDVIRFNVDSATSVTRVNLVFKALV